MFHLVRRSAAFVALLLSGCGSTTAAPTSASPRVAPYTTGTRIAWDARTRQRPFDGPASYPRMIRLASGALLCSFESEGASLAMHSVDDGITWSAPVVAAAREGDVGAAVPSLVQLHDGTVLLAYNPRPPADNQDSTRHFALRVKASHDGGRSWDTGVTVFTAGYQWARGVWEPSMIQLPDGEIQVFAANEYPYAESLDQEITRFRSTDGGESWSGGETVSYRPGHRDGMPVPLQLHGGRGLVVAIEDDGLVEGPFKPALLDLRTDGSAAGTPIGGGSPRRRAALVDGAELPVEAYAGAPYLAQLPSGETLLSFQSNAGRGGDWTNSTMVVAVGSEDAGGFGHATRPFPVRTGRHALWGSLFVKDSSTVTALTTTTAFDSSRQELYMVDGRPFTGLTSPYGVVEVDGLRDDAVWAEAAGLPVGGAGGAVAAVRTAWDEAYFYVLFEPSAPGAPYPPDTRAAAEAFLVGLATDSLSADAPVDGAFRVRVGASGRLRLDEGRGGAWEVADPLGLVVGIGESAVELAIPWQVLGGRPASGRGWGVDFGLEARDLQGRSVEEWLPDTDPVHPRTWVRVVLRSGDATSSTHR